MPSAATWGFSSSYQWIIKPYNHSYRSYVQISGTYHHDCAHKNNTPKCYPGHNHQPLVPIPAMTPWPITVLDRSQVLMALNEGGMQYLIAGARANVGLKGGRHMFEAPVRIIAAWDIFGRGWSVSIDVMYIVYAHVSKLWSNQSILLIFVDTCWYLLILVDICWYLLMSLTPILPIFHETVVLRFRSRPGQHFVQVKITEMYHPSDAWSGSFQRCSGSFLRDHIAGWNKDSMTTTTTPREVVGLMETDGNWIKKCSLWPVLPPLGQGTIDCT